MDTHELIELGARAMVVKLCKQIEEIIGAAPSVQRFARDMMRETLGMKPVGPRGPYVKAVNGTTAKRLATELIAAREARGKSGRPPMSEAQKKKMSRITKQRWARAKAAGISGGKLPSKAQLNGVANEMSGTPN